MEIMVTVMNRVDLIVVEGSINASSVGEFDETVNSRLDRGAMNLVIDLSQVDYLSSSGIRVLVAALKRTSAVGGCLKLAALSPRAREVLELAGLLTVFEIYADQVSAVGSL